MAEDAEGIEFLGQFFAEKSDGYLIDVGAHDGVIKGSMTRALLQKGWGGLMVEPLPEAYDKLEEAYRENPKVHTVQGACSDREGRAVLHPCQGVSTLDPQWAKACSDWWKHVEYGKPLSVSLNTLTNLLSIAQAPAKIDLLQIDTEGHDFFVLRGMDWKRKPSIVVVETLDMVHLERKMHGVWHPDPDMNAYLRSLGYRLERLTPGGNAIYIREDGE